MKLRTRPTMRESKRYIYFKIHTDELVSYELMKNTINEVLLNWIGERDLAKANFRFVKNLWNPKNKTGVLQCTPKFVDPIKVGLGLVHQMAEQKVLIQTLKVSGTIKSLGK